jgi:hypothetical protein
MAGARHHRPGITRVEVILIVIVLLTGLAILLSALPRLHEESYHVVCANNLRVIGKAIHLYSDQQKSLPASRIDAPFASWVVQIMPFVHPRKDNPLAGWELTKTYYDQPEAVRRTLVPEFFCPARRRPVPDSTSGDVPAGANDKNFDGALGDYACASSTGDPAHPWDTHQANGAIIPAEVIERDGQRVVKWRSLTSLAMLEAQRGLSNTILVGEKHVALGDFGQAKQGDGSIYNGDHLASFARKGGPGYGLARSAGDPFHANFGSYHPGICQFLFADGSVRTLAPTISEDLLGRLIARDKEADPP